MTVARFTNGLLARADGTLESGDLFVDSLTGRIISGQDHFYQSRRDADQTIDLRGDIAAPGYIDAQINGAYGVDFSCRDQGDALYLKSLDKVSNRIVETGTTSYVPTIITQKREMYPKLLSLLQPRSMSGCAHVLGYHAEGPFLFPEKKGAHDESYLLEATEGIKTWEDVYGAESLDQPGVKVITAAPDVTGVLECIAPATSRGATVSVGHSNAPVDLASKAIAQGAAWVTHLFNAMPQMHHRDPGVIGLLGAQVQSQRPYYGLIADGIHVHPNAVRLAYDCHPDGAVLVTDAMSLMDPKMTDGRHEWRDGRCIVKEGLRLRIDGTSTLAGAAISMDACVRNLATFTSISLGHAIKAATYNVAQMLGGEVAQRKGSLDVGKDADLVILSPDGFVRATWIMGQQVYQAAP